MCFISVIIVILSSASYLIVLEFSNSLPTLMRIRFANFIVQHFFSAGMLMIRQFFWSEIETWKHLLWMIGFTTANFLDFVVV